MLTGAAAAAPAIALAAATEPPAPPEPPIEEAPELLELGRQLPGLAGRVEAITARHTEAMATFERLRPQLPDDLILKTGENWELAAEERGPDGHVVRQRPYGPRRILQSKLIRAHLILHEVPRNKHGTNLRRLARMAKKYETSFAAAARSAGIDPALDELCDVVCAVDKVAYAMIEVQPRTMLGVQIVAQVADLRHRAHEAQDGHAKQEVDAFVVASLVRIVDRGRT
jgi:DNA-directed RNA polymerase subunit F